MNEYLQPLIIFLFSLIGGVIIGYALRKIIKVLLILGGAFIFSLVVLQGLGWMQPNYDKMIDDTETFASDANLDQVQGFTSQFNPIVLVGLLIGTIVGFFKVGNSAKQLVVK